MGDQDKAVDVLRRMGGLGELQAARYLERCTPEEISAIGQCETGQDYSAVINSITDRQLSER